MTAAASRRPAATPPVEQAPPPPLQQPDLHGRRQDPAAEAWLPESTLDPATRAWLTSADRGAEQQPPAVPVQRPDDFTPRTAPSHVHGAGSGLADWSAQQPTGDAGSTVSPAEPSGPEQPSAPTQPDRPVAPRAPEAPFTPQPPEPPLDPNAYPSAPAEGDDPEVTRIAERPEAAQPDTPRWSPPAEQPAAPAPSGPSWWVGRSAAANESTGSGTDETSAVGAADAGDDRASGNIVSPPQPGDTAVVEPLVDRRPHRPAPLVTPGSQATTCHVCGHRLEPDDIFCAECGAVRPAVTAAFTGPIVPLPVARPDWAADDSDEVATQGGEAQQDGEPQQDGEARQDVEPTHGGEVAHDAAPDAAAHEVPVFDAAEHAVPVSDAAAEVDGTAHDEAVAHDDQVARGGAPDDGVPADGAHDGSAGILPSWVNGGGTDAPTEAAPGRPRGAHAAPEAGSPVAGEPFVPPVPGSATVPSSAPSAQDTAAVGVPTAAPLPPLPGAAGAVLPGASMTDGPTSADADLEDDVDETRIVSATPTRAPFVLHFSTGERFGVHGTGLVGRLPRPQPGERFDDLLTVHDPGKSVSKTHLELGRDGDDLWVSDRFSGNGTVVRHIDGSIRRCEPGRRYRVERGARVDIGEQFFLVQ